VIEDDANVNDPALARRMADELHALIAARTEEG
jgi:hypothetical protein